MKNATLAVLLTSTGFAFAAGFGIAWQVFSAPTEPEAANIEIKSQATTRNHGPANMSQFADLWNGSQTAQTRAGPARIESLDELWQQAMLPADRQQPGLDAEDRLRKMAQSDPSALHGLLQRYDTEHSVNARNLLKAILGTVQNPEVLAFSKRMATTSGDPSQRQAGFEILQNLSTDPAEIRGVVRQALASEQTPSVLVQALAALKPAAVEPAEAEAIVAQLRNLAQHPDPTVRSQSILQLAQWDKKGEGLDSFSQALTDQAPAVRQTAVFAIAQSGDRSDGVKSLLMGMIGNPNETREVRGSALQVLERFALSKEEFASFNQARSQVQGS